LPSKTLKILKKAGLAGLSIFAFSLNWAAGLCVLNMEALINSPPVRDEVRLEQLIEEQREFLDVPEGWKISFKLLAEDAACSEYFGNDSFEVRIGGIYANESVVQHEMYHIADGHHKSNSRIKGTPLGIFNIKNPITLMMTPKYLYWDEPQATVYQVFGWKP